MDALAQAFCPCCHRPLGRTLAASELSFLALALPANSRVTGPLLDLLCDGRPRKIEVLVEHVYASRPNGEPNCGVKSIQVAIVHLRRRLAPYGWTITDGRRGGYRLERVAALERTEAAA